MAPRTVQVLNKNEYSHAEALRETGRQKGWNECQVLVVEEPVPWVEPLLTKVNLMDPSVSSKKKSEAPAYTQSMSRTRQQG